MLSIHYQSLEAKLSPIIREIIESQAKCKTELDSVYNKVISSLILRSGLGNPTKESVLKETTVVLASVFPAQDLSLFLSQSRLDKKSQLKELSDIVAGIRIFNWDCKRGGAGIDDLPAILSNAMETTMANFEAMRSYTDEKVGKLTAIVEKLLYTNKGMEIAEKEKNKFKFGLVNLRQFQTYLIILIRDLEGVNNRLGKLDQDLLSQLKEIQKLLANRLAAVPTDQIFPQFIRLAKIWKGFQDNMIVLSRITSLNQVLHGFTSNLKKLPIQKSLKELKIQEWPSDEEREIINCQGNNSFAEDEFECRILGPGDVSGYDRLRKEYSGFCPVALVSGQGFVLPGNSKLGLLGYQGKLYSCSTWDRYEQFGKNPAFFTSTISKLINDNFYLKNLLDPKDEMKLQAVGKGTGK